PRTYSNVSPERLASPPSRPARSQRSPVTRSTDFHPPERTRASGSGHVHGLRGGLDPVLVRLRVQLGFRLAQLRDRLLEVLQRLERPVDRGEPQVGDQIQLPQRPEYREPHLVGGQFG